MCPGPMSPVGVCDVEPRGHHTDLRRARPHDLCPRYGVDVSSRARSVWPGVQHHPARDAIDTRLGLHFWGH